MTEIPQKVPAAGREITAKYFEEKVGVGPVFDDLERCNCEDAGRPGHYQCGWCLDHDQPRFLCGCRGGCRYD